MKKDRLCFGCVSLRECSADEDCPNKQEYSHWEREFRKKTINERCEIKTMKTKFETDMNQLRSKFANRLLTTDSLFEFVAQAVKIGVRAAWACDYCENINSIEDVICHSCGAGRRAGK